MSTSGTTVECRGWSRTCSWIGCSALVSAGDRFRALPIASTARRNPWRIRHRIPEEVPAKVAEDPACQIAAANNDKANAKIAMVDALGRVMLSLVRDKTQLFKEYSDNADFKTWLEDAVFRATYKKTA